jgi:uncharacterized RDD family membrane protein YckC
MESNSSPVSLATAPLDVRYATFTGRVRALLVDTILVMAVVVTVLMIGDALDAVPGIGRVAWLVLFFALFLYEPVFVSRRGATIGHARNHLIVTDVDSAEPPGFLRALCRYLIKMVLGIPSFLSMGLTRRHQALHDVLTRTCVRVVSNHELPSYDYHLERTVNTSGLPSRRRRVVVIAIYLVVTFVVIGAVTLLLLSPGCVREQFCSSGDQTWNRVLNALWLIGSGLLIVAGWRGRLPGARRLPEDSPDALVV